ELDINKNDLRIDTFRASGAGGQHINKTDSAIRVTHLPTGLVVECQDERSQHKNRAKALAVLATRLRDAQRQAAQAEQAATRKSLVGSGDRSERIRTYNYPQGRITDHRINLTLYKLDEVVQGDLNPVIEPLIREHQANLLAAVSDSAGLDAELLLAGALQKDRAWLYTWADRELSSAELALAEPLLQRRAAGEPVAYILGWRDFWSLRLQTEPSTLLPRPD